MFFARESLFLSGRNDYTIAQLDSSAVVVVSGYAQYIHSQRNAIPARRVTLSETGSGPLSSPLQSKFSAMQVRADRHGAPVVAALEDFNSCWN